MEQKLYPRNLSWIYVLQMEKIRGLDKDVPEEDKGHM